MHLELGLILKERWLNCWSLGILIAITLLIKQVHSSGAIGDIEHNLIKPPPRASTSGLIKMCPPGGEIFTTGNLLWVLKIILMLLAWQLSCGMKKRRKRDIVMRPGKSIFCFKIVELEF